MQSVDGDVRLSVSFDMKSVQTNLVQLKKAIKDTLGGFDSVGSKVTPQVADLEKELANATKKIKAKGTRLSFIFNFIILVGSLSILQ